MLLKSNFLSALSILVKQYSDQKPALLFHSCFELLIAVILSAQCTDMQVNKVTPLLFGKWPNPSDLSAADIREVERIIKSTGFFRVKSRSIIACSKMLIERFNSKIPNTIDELLLLPGVGRKTANLILSACHDKPGLIIDTHVSRVCYRLGFSENRDPYKIEKQLSRVLPSDHWTKASYALNSFGKKKCFSRNPDCFSCPVKIFCLYFRNLKEK